MGIKKEYLISYTYIYDFDLYEALVPLPTNSYRTDTITKKELKLLVKGIKIGLDDRLVGEIIISEIK